MEEETATLKEEGKVICPTCFEEVTDENEWEDNLNVCWVCAQQNLSCVRNDES